MKYSLVVTSFNSSSTIETVLKNVKGIRTPPSEVIIIDDCSEDDSPTLIHETILGYPEYRLIQNKVNKGQSYSRNLGVQLSSYEFVIFQDDDDISLLNRADIHLEAFSQGADFSYLSSTKRYPNGYTVTNINSDISSSKLQPELIIKHLSIGLRLPQDLKLYSPSSTLAVRRDLFISLGGFRSDMRRLEDIELACRALMNDAILTWSSEIGIERLHTVGDDKSATANLQGELQVVASVRKYLNFREYFVAQQMILLREAYFSGKFRRLFSRAIYIPVIIILSPHKISAVLRRIVHDLRQRL